MHAAIRVLWKKQTPAALTAFLWVSLSVCFRSFAAESLPFQGAKSPLDYVTRVEALTFADLVYDDDFGRKRIPDGWNLLRSGDAGLKDSPLRWAVYERASDGQRILSFAGTRSGGDWADNLYSSGSLAPAEALIRGSPELYKAVGLSPHFQYDQALQKAVDEVHANQFSGRGRPLVPVGDSKAGGQIEYVSSMLRLPGVARNPAPLGNDLLSRIPEGNKKWANSGGVLRIEAVPDAVSKLDVLPGSTHLGVQESYEIPKAWRDEYLRSSASPNPVQSVAGAIGYSVFSHTERDLLLRAVSDKERTVRPVSVSAPSFTSQSSLASDLNQFSRETIAGGVADNLHLLPGRAGELGELAKIGFQGVDFLHSIYDSLDYIQRHPGDPASDWERTSIGLNLYSLIGRGELLPGVAGGLATVGGLAKTFGEATRNRVLENRAERLVNFGGAVLQGAARTQEEMESHYGYFSLTSDRYSAQGGWDLRDSNERLFERNSQSTVWANTEVRGLQTANGSEISGIFRRSERREERGGSIFNLYEPKSVTITRHSYDSYRVTFDGSRWNEDTEPRSVSSPLARSPETDGAKYSPTPFVNDTEYLPRQNDPLFFDPRRFRFDWNLVDDDEPPPDTGSGALGGGDKLDPDGSAGSALPVGGVKVKFNSMSVSTNEGGELRELRKAILQQRPDNDALSWPVSK